MNIDWATALCGAAVGWIACGKLDEVEQKFATTVAVGSAEGVKAAMKASAKKAKKQAKKGAGAGNGNGNGNG